MGVLRPYQFEPIASADSVAQGDGQQLEQQMTANSEGNDSNEWKLTDISW